MKYLSIFFIGTLLFLTNCKKEVINQHPTCVILSPADSIGIVFGKTIPIVVYGNDIDGKISKATIIANGLTEDLIVDDTIRYNLNTEILDIGENRIKISVEDDKGALGSDEVLIFLIEEKKGELFDLRDSEIYKTVKIGNQWWMSENLNFKSDSDSRVYNNDPTNAEIYGRLYNWKIANQVCPSGWHLPNKDELYELIIYLGGFDVAGGKMKKDAALWNSPNYGASDSSEFAGLPGGSYNQTIYDQKGIFACFWAANEMKFNNTYSGLFYRLDYDREKVEQYYTWKEYGFSVRCIKDK